MIKKFTLLLLAMLCIAGTTKADHSLELNSLSTGDNGSNMYDQASHVLSFNNSWNGSQWWFSEAGVDYSAYDKFILEYDNVTGDISKFRIQINYAGGVTTQTFYVTPEQKCQNTTSCKGKVAIKLDETGKSKVKNIYLTSAGGNAYSIHLTAAYFRDPKTLEGSQFDDLFSGSNEFNNIESAYTSLSWSGNIKDLANAQMGDVIKVTLNGTGAEESSLAICDGSYDEYPGASRFSNLPKADNLTVEYEINSATTLEKIHQQGIVIKGRNVTMTKVELKKYEGRYDAYDVTIGEDRIATWSCNKHLNFAGVGITPYYASEVSSGQVTLTSVESTRAYVGYIVEGEAGTYEVPVGSDPGWIDAFNNLRAMGDYAGPVYKSKCTEYTDGDDTNNESTTTEEYKIKNYFRYIFAKHGSDIGFYLLDTDYSEGGKTYHTLAAHKAYLETSENYASALVSMGPRSYMRLSFGGGGGTTAINTALKNPIVEDGLYYTLQGVAVKNPTKGIYILNGKKVFVK